jgi:hypothetical protein
MTGGRKVPFTCGAGIFGAGVALIAAIFLVGCAGSPVAGPGNATGDSLPGLNEPTYFPAVIATCDPPIGWQAQPLKANSRHTHQLWVSPSGMTAYGVVHFKLPWPIGPDLALSGFISAMGKSEGGAELVEKHVDTRGIAFIADGGQHHIRGQLIVQGWEAWAFYSATVRGKPIVPDELKLAELAAAHTEIRDVEPPMRQARAGEE